MADISPTMVHETLNKFMLTDGMDIVYDMEKSRGSYLHDAKKDSSYLDLFSCFASMPIGHNHPKMRESKFCKRLLKAAVNKPTNSDLYTTYMAEFVDTFSRVSLPDSFKHLFFICGGALAVENALKVSMDWKVRKNFAAGKTQELGHQVIHFKNAFHGRTGYTLSLTNTFDPAKHMYFAKFDWPRIDTPDLTFPVTEKVIERVKEEEDESIRQINKALEDRGEDISAMIIEPIQGEGGDRHFRPEFMARLRKVCDGNDVMLVFDEIQSGFGLTGEWWAYQHYDVAPDIISFGKKTQVCGIMANERVDEINENVFEKSSRLNSTWGGNLVDMVRCQKYLEIMEEEKLVKNARRMGEYLHKRLLELQDEFPEVTNVRGKGLMCAFDLPSSKRRDAVIDTAFEKGVIILGCGESSMRFRPHLVICNEEIDKGIEVFQEAIRETT